MTQNILYEIDRRPITITKIEESIISWQKNVLTVRYDKGIQLYEFSHNLHCFDKNISCTEIYLPVVKKSPAEKLFTGKIFDKYTPNTLYTDMLLEPAMWAHNQSMLEDLVNVSNYSWSPVGFVQNNQCALAVLTNVGQLDIFACKESKWTNIFSLSPYLSLRLKNEPMKPERLKQEVYKASVCAMAWSPVLLPNHTCILATNQKDGAICFWRLQNTDFDVKASLIGETKCECFEMNSILWVNKTETEFCLVCSDITGEVTAFEFSMENNSITFKNQCNLWSHKDKMVAHNFNYIKRDNNYILIYSKHRHLVLQLLNENLKNLGQYIKNINDHRIKNITSTLDGFYVTTSNCEIFRLNVSILDENMDVTITKQETKDKDLASSFEMIGVEFSPNKIICAMAMINRQIYCRKLRNRIEVSFMTTEQTMDSVFSVLLDNPYQSLQNYWDCIHLLRYRTMKLKQMPAADYDRLYRDSLNNIYKMKLYLICLILHNKLKSIVNIVIEPPFPETSVDSIKDLILLHHATETIKNLYKIQKESSLTNFQVECYRGCIMFVEDYCKKNNKNIKMMLNEDLLTFTESDSSMCQWCDELLDRFTCKDGHLNMFCSLTFTQINTDEYLVCKACDAIARPELYSIDPTCVFCDLFLQKIYENT